jgi:hypothetical protein
MLKRWILVILMLFMQGCSLENLFVTKEIDKVYVVKYTSYVKHHRAYFARETLHPFSNKKRYLLLYNPKKHDLGVLLHKNNAYLLYSLSRPNLSPVTYHPSGKVSEKTAIRHFARMGYKKANVHTLGYSVTTGLRRYKGVKTLMVDVKDYSRLLKRYRKAIATYDAREVLSVKEKLPPSFIEGYLLSRYRKAHSDEARAQLLRIASKLGIKIPDTAPLEDTVAGKSKNKSYYYYLYFAPTDELRNYIEKSENEGSLSTKQLHGLKVRLKDIERKKLLSEGSLDELIAFYKQHKDPQVKQRIMELLKAQQKH